MMHFIKVGRGHFYLMLVGGGGGIANGIRFTRKDFALQSDGGKEQEYFV